MITDLYSVSPIYRKLTDELHRLAQENGALSAAYQNALNDQKRAKDDLRALVEQVDDLARRYEIIQRDDPGLLGSGSRPNHGSDWHEQR